MSNRPKLQKPRISNREMARDTKTLIGAGVEMCKLLAFIHDTRTAERLREMAVRMFKKSNAGGEGREV